MNLDLIKLPHKHFLIEFDENMIIVHIFYDLKNWVRTFANMKDQFATKNSKMTNLIQKLNLKTLGCI